VFNRGDSSLECLTQPLNDMGCGNRVHVRYRTRKNDLLLQNIKIMDFLIEIFEIHVGIRHSIPGEEQNKK